MTKTIFPFTLSEADWRKRLSPEQYYVMREHGTERPGSCALLHEKRAGVFTCAGCEQSSLHQNSNLKAARVGRVSMILFRVLSRQKQIAAMAWCAQKCIAAIAVRIWAMSFLMARPPRACAIASMAWL
jgi:hypothetical protein